MRQTLITMACDKCDKKAIFSSSADPDYNRWGTFAAGDIGHAWSVGRKGNVKGKTAHMCPNCLGEIKKWWTE